MRRVVEDKWVAIKNKIIDKIISENWELREMNCDDACWTYENSIPPELKRIKDRLVFDPMYDGDESWVNVYLSFEFFPGERYPIRIDRETKYYWYDDQTEEAVREEFVNILVSILKKADRLKNFLVEPEWEFAYVDVDKWEESLPF